jgi:hypothetical protein
MSTIRTGQGPSAQVAVMRGTVYGSEGWGFESLRARPGQRHCACLAAAFVLTDLLTPASLLAGIDRAKMSAAAAT